MVTKKVFEDKRTVQVFGSSLAITLPSTFVKACEISKGMEMRVFYGLEAALVIFREDCPDKLEKLRDFIERLEQRG